MAWSVVGKVSDAEARDAQTFLELPIRSDSQFCTNAYEPTAILNAFLGTGRLRFGCIPSVTHDIQQVCLTCQQHGVPIPVLVPFGGMKPDPLRPNIDLAEVAAMKMLEAINSRVKAVYPPGCRFRVRCEDTGARFLFRRQGREAERAIELYAGTFPALPHHLGLGAFIDVFLESALVKQTVYDARCHYLAPIFREYLLDTDAPGMLNPEASPFFDKLARLGWQGTIPREQRDYYYSTYRRLYGSNSAQCADLLGEYLAGALVRKEMGLSGVLPEWGKCYLEVSFMPPVPGVPQALSSRRLHYRTLPEQFTRQHMPPWRCYGYMRLAPSGIASPCLVSSRETLDARECWAMHAQGLENIAVRCDYARPAEMACRSHAEHQGSNESPAVTR